MRDQSCKKVLIIGKNSYLAGFISSILKENEITVYYLSHLSVTNKSLGIFNILDLDKVPKVDIVINCAVCYGKHGETYEEIISANILYPLKALNWAINKGIKYYINTSTAISNDINSYTLTKKHFSHWGDFLANKSDIKFIDVILEHYFGPNCSDNNFIASMIHSMANNTKQIELTKGIQLRDFVYIEDVAQAYFYIIKNITKFDESYTKVSVGYGTPYKIKDVCELIKSKLGSKSILKFGALPYRKNEVMYSCADTKLLYSLGWKPKFDIDAGISEIIKKENLK